MQKTVRLNLHSDIKLKLTEDKFPFQEKEVIEVVNPFSNNEEDDFYPTLRDVSIILWSMVGNGVTWQLAYELSKRLSPDVSKNPYEISEILSEIFSEYFEMSEDEAHQKHEEYPRLHSPSCPTPLAYV